MTIKAKIHPPPVSWHREPKTRKPTRIGPIDRLDRTHFEVVAEDRGPGFERLSTLAIKAICVGPMSDARTVFEARVAGALTYPKEDGGFETELTNFVVPGTFDRLDQAIEAALPFCLIPETPQGAPTVKPKKTSKTEPSTPRTTASKAKLVDENSTLKQEVLDLKTRLANAGSDLTRAKYESHQTKAELDRALADVDSWRDAANDFRASRDLHEERAAKAEAKVASLTKAVEDGVMVEKAMATRHDLQGASLRRKINVLETALAAALGAVR